MHKNIFILLIIAYILCSSTQISAQENNSVKSANALLWEISGKGIKKPSYLFGTIHVLPKSEFFFTPEMKKAFLSSKELVMEIDMNISMSEQVQMMQAMMLPAGKSLADYMQADEYSKYISYLKDSLKLSPLNLMILPKIKPLFSFSLILQDKLENPVSFEMYFQKLAKKHKMKISGLESLQEQMDIINSIPIEEQVRLLTDTTNYETDILKAYYQLIAIYKEQNILQLSKEAADEKLIRKYSGRLIDKRNKYWISILEEKIKSHPCFIAVGAGHLSGKDGLINLIRLAGYEINPVKIHIPDRNNSSSKDAKAQSIDKK